MRVRKRTFGMPGALECSGTREQGAAAAIADVLAVPVANTAALWLRWLPLPNDLTRAKLTRVGSDLFPPLRACACHSR